MLSKLQIRYLKSLGNRVEQKYQVGKNEITETLLDMLDNALNKYELIKICVNKSVVELKNQFAKEITELLHAELIQIIGGVILIYRKNLENPKIVLPR